jgi:hypothetical protein
VARVVGQKLGDKWGQAVVIENKPGGNGVVAAQALLAKPADGYTLLVTDATMFSAWKRAPASPASLRQKPNDRDFTRSQASRGNPGAGRRRRVDRERCADRRQR